MTFSGITVQGWMRQWSGKHLLAAGYLVAGLAATWGYFYFTSVSGVLGLLALLFSLRRGQSTGRNPYLIPALGFLLLTVAVPVKTFLFFGFFFSLFAFLQHRSIRVPFTGVAAVV